MRRRDIPGTVSRVGASPEQRFSPERLVTVLYCTTQYIELVRGVRRFTPFFTPRSALQRTGPHWRNITPTQTVCSNAPPLSLLSSSKTIQFRTLRNGKGHIQYIPQAGSLPLFLLLTTSLHHSLPPHQEPPHANVVDMKCHLIVITFAAMAGATHGLDWNKYNSTYNVFGDFWDDSNELFTSVDRPGATCADVYGHDAKWIISACQSPSDIPNVRSGCYWVTQIGEQSTDITFAIMQTPCPDGMWYCSNVEDDSLWQTLPRMHAQCS